MAKFINDLLDLYANGDLTDDDLLQWTENRRRLEEYHADVQQHRLREKMKRKQDESIRLGLSPETIVIRREEEEKFFISSLGYNQSFYRTSGNYGRNTLQGGD